MSSSLDILILLILILLNGVFAMSEISLVTSRRARLARRGHTAGSRRHVASSHACAVGGPGRPHRGAGHPPGAAAPPWLLPRSLQQAVRRGICGPHPAIITRIWKPWQRRCRGFFTPFSGKALPICPPVTDRLSLAPIDRFPPDRRILREISDKQIHPLARIFTYLSAYEIQPFPIPDIVKTLTAIFSFCFQLFPKKVAKPPSFRYNILRDREEGTCSM